MDSELRRLLERILDPISTEATEPYEVARVNALVIQGLCREALSILPTLEGTKDVRQA